MSLKYIYPQNGKPWWAFEFAETGPEPQQQHRERTENHLVIDNPSISHCDAHRRRRHVRDTDAVADIRGPGKDLCTGYERVSSFMGHLYMCSTAAHFWDDSKTILYSIIVDLKLSLTRKCNVRHSFVASVEVWACGNYCIVCSEESEHFSCSLWTL